jgi:hypothetical protein
MIDDQTLLLTQILDELKQQNQYLFDIRKRLESLESAVGKDRARHESAKDQVRGN